jgi:hypothetical protein
MTAAEIPVLKISVDFNVSFNQTLEHRIMGQLFDHSNMQLAFTDLNYLQFGLNNKKF